MTLSLLSLFNNPTLLGSRNQELLFNSELEQLQLSTTWEKLTTTPAAQTSTQELTLSLDAKTTKIGTERVGSEKIGPDIEKDLSTSNDVVPSDSLLATPTTAFAVSGNVLQVTTTADENDGSSSGTGLSLRDAILQANANPNSHYIIELQAGEKYSLTLDGTGEYNSKTGDLNINKGNNITIKTFGGEENAIISAQGLGDRVFYVTKASTLNLENITVADGYLSSITGKGGNFRIASGSEVNFIDSVVENGYANSGGGLNISDSTVTFDNSILRGNDSKEGGAIKIEITSTSKNARLSLNNSQITENDSSKGAIMAVQLKLMLCFLVVERLMLRANFRLRSQQINGVKVSHVLLMEMVMAPLLLISARLNSMMVSFLTITRQLLVLLAMIIC